MEKLGGGDFEWSPDMRWICYTHRGESKAWNLWIVLRTASAIRERHAALRASRAARMVAGREISFFQSNRDGNGLYVLPLTGEDVRVSDTDLNS